MVDGATEVHASLMSRATEANGIAKFLAAVEKGPAGLVFEGDAGIGKTTHWLNAGEQARTRGLTVLSARAAETESVLAYTSIADLLRNVDTTLLAELPAPQRIALERALLLRAADDGPATDYRAVAAGFSSLLNRLAETGPTVLAIDDLQWLDGSSRQIVDFAARRLSGPVGVLATVRTADRDAAGWLQLPQPTALTRISVHPLSERDLTTVVSSRLARSLSRSASSRLYAVTAGNPFYGIEFARNMTDDGHGGSAGLPESLAEVVRARLAALDEDVRDLLLVAASVPSPTLDLVAAVTRTDPQRVTDVLAAAERHDVIAIWGSRLRFTHPMLAHFIYSDAAADRRRAVHRELADVVDEPELHARHLALSATSNDPAVAEALDLAATSALARGAPAAAAELLEHAIALGNDRFELQIRLASCHLDASDFSSARSILDGCVAGLSPGPMRAHALGLLATVRAYEDSFTESYVLLERALSDIRDDPMLACQLLVILAYALVNTGKTAEATARADESVGLATELGDDSLLARALGIRTIVGFMAGDGFDAATMERAVALDDPRVEIPLAIRPRTQHALLLAWTGELDAARTAMRDLRQQCDDRGKEAELTFIAFTSTLIAIWRGDLIEAARIAGEANDLGQRLASDLPVFTGLLLNSMVAAYTGDVESARRDAAEALAASERSGSARLSEWVPTTLGFLETSLADYPAALAALMPQIARVRAIPNDTEIVSASFVPDAIESLIGVGRLDEAEELVAMLEHNGARLDRPWILAVGSRGRAQLAAARGDVRAAITTVELTFEHHERLRMPFERARSMLLLGQLQRRLRRREAAVVTLSQVADTFEELGMTLWAARARGELERARFGANRATELTESERRVAELSAQGMTNRDVAARLFVSPKTVEGTLARIYRKLGIHSRAELGRHLIELDRGEE